MTTRKSPAATAATAARNRVSAEAAAPAEAAGAAEAARAKPTKAVKVGQVSPKREQVVQLAGEGRTAAQIAEVTGLSVAGVRHHLKAAGLTAARPEREQRVSPHRAEVARLAGEGKTAAQIAEATGLSVAGVRHHLGALGLAAARPGREVSPHRATVQAMAADGKSARQIAEATGLTVPGVRHHLKALRQAVTA